MFNQNEAIGAVGRPSSFDKQQVLTSAMQIFWKQGYTATSMADLCAVTQLQPGSVYHSFGSKKALFLEVVEFYIDHVVGERIEKILKAGAPLEGIEVFFRTAYEDLPADEQIGCLLTNSATEFGNYDKQINTTIRKGMNKIERAFKLRLQQAQTTGQICETKDAAVLAVHLTSCFQGLEVISRVTKDQRRLRVITDCAMLPLLS